MQKLFSSLLITITLLITQLAPAHAQTTTTELDLSFSPPVTYLSVQPGETKTIELKLKNSGTRNLKIQLELADFEANGTTGQPVLKFNSTFPYLKAKDPAWSWQQPQVVKSGETVSILFEVALPKTVSVKESHLTVLARASQISEAPGSKTATLGSSGQVSGLIGSNIILAVSDSNVNLSKLDFFNWQPPKFVDSLRGIKIAGLIKNQGIHAGPIIGKASLVGPSGQLLKSWLFFPDMVLPGSTRELRVIDTTSDPSADPTLWLSQPNNTLENKLSYQPSWLFGNYTLKVQLFKTDYTDAQPSVTENYQITALPFGILAGLVGLPLMYWLITKSRSQLHQNLAKKAAQTETHA